MIVGLLDVLIRVLAGFVALLAITGGGILRTANAKIEFAELGPWVAALALLLGIWWLARGRSFSRTAEADPDALAPTGWRRDWHRLWAWLTDPKATGRRARGLIAAVFGTLFIAHVVRHLSLQTNGYDVTFVYQALYHAWNGPRLLPCDLCIGGSYIGEHLSFTLLLLAPIAWVARSLFPSGIGADELLFLTQTLLLAVPFALALQRGPLRDRRALWALGATIALCSVPLRAAAVWDLREDHLGFAFGFGLLLALQSGRAWLAAIWVALLWGTKENFAWITIALPLPILLDRTLPLRPASRGLLAAFVAVGSIAAAIFQMRYLLPWATQGLAQAHQIVQRFPGMGTTPFQVVLFIATHPLQILRDRLFDPTGFKYLLFLTGPFLVFLPRAWIWLAPVAPGVLMNLLSFAPTQRALTYHYELVFLPYLIWAAWRGMASTKWLAASASSPRSGPARARWAIPLLLALALSGRWPGFYVTSRWPSLADWQGALYLRSLPSDGVTLAGALPLAQLSRCTELREQGVPDRTGIPGHGSTQATRVILDRLAPAPWLDGEMLEKMGSDPGGGWLRRSQSADGRFTELRR